MDRSSDTSPARAIEPALVACAALAIAVINLRLWGVDYPPLTDWPNHLVRHALQCAEDPTAGIGRYYIFDLALVPNLTSDLVHLLPFACASVLTTQKVLIQFATTGLVLSTLLLHFSIWRRWSVWPLLSAFTMHHMAFAYGFENYVLAMPPVLLALALWFALSDRDTLVRLGAMIPVAGVIYIFHLYAFGFLGLSVGLLELHRWWRGERSGAALAKVLAGGMAVAVGPMLHLMASTSGATGIDLGQTSFGEFGLRLLVPLAPFVSVGFPQHSLDPANMALAQMIILYGLLLFGALTYRLRAPADRLLQFAPGTGLALFGALVLTLFIPAILGAVHFTHIRFPVLFLCLVIAASDLRLSRIGAVAFAALIVGSMALRVGWLEGKWREHDLEVRELLTLERHLDGEDRLLLARAGSPGDALLHSHSPAHLARRTGLFLPGTFSGGNSLSPRPEVALRDVTQSYPIEISEVIAEARAPRAPESLTDTPGQRYWADWPAFYSHVLVLSAPDAEIEAAPELGRLVRRGSFFALFETVPR